VRNGPSFLDWGAARASDIFLIAKFKKNPSPFLALQLEPDA
jgi:hypothetical protein